MKLRALLLVILAGAAIGGLWFLYQKTQSVDSDLHLRRLARIRAVDNLDVQLNRAFTQSRTSSLGDAAGDRSAITAKLGEALDAIDKGPESLRNLSADLDKALEAFLETIESKFELGFDFEANNTLRGQRLINSLDAVPLDADRLAAIRLADPALQEQVAALTTQLKTEMLTHGVTPTPANGPGIEQTLETLSSIAATQGDDFKAAFGTVRARVKEAMADKGELVSSLRDFLDRPTGQQLEKVQQTYISWQEGQVAIANQYRLWLVAYAAGLLLVLALLGVRLARSYRELDKAHGELVHANEHLEEQVLARTKDLSTALKDLQASQAQLVQSEKMASLGQMVAGVAHEINTPLGYARSNAEIVRTSLADIRDLCSAQDKALQLMTSEGASDEQIARAVADADARRESVNPGELMGDLDNLLKDADHGLVQIAELVSSLKDFSRVDRSREDVIDLNAGIESALKIAHNQLKHRVEVVKQFGKLPKIQCSPSQLNQVFLNLVTNAAQAIEGQGKVYIHTMAEGDGVVVKVLDNGCGMSEEVQKRIFEPFFTTKPVGKGTGLGLSIVYRIIEEHGGKITVRSTPGKGSEFTIRLPARQKRPDAPSILTLAAA